MRDFFKETDGRFGFTMMEVLTGLAIISIVTSVVLPSLSNFYSSTRVKAEAEIFVANLRKARYQAIRDQALFRLIIHPDGGAYKVQAYLPDYEGVDYTGAFPTSASPIPLDADAMLEYESLEWASVIDQEEHEVDPMVQIFRSNFMPQIIFLRPNGLLYWDSDGDLSFSPADQEPLGECFVTFVYGSAAIRVVVNAMGVFSSEAYKPDDDYDYDNDDSLVLW